MRGFVVVLAVTVASGCASLGMTPVGSSVFTEAQSASFQESEVNITNSTIAVYATDRELVAYLPELPVAVVSASECLPTFILRGRGHILPSGSTYTADVRESPGGSARVFSFRDKSSLGKVPCEWRIATDQKKGVIYAGVFYEFAGETTVDAPDFWVEYRFKY